MQSYLHVTSMSLTNLNSSNVSTYSPFDFDFTEPSTARFIVASPLINLYKFSSLPFYSNKVYPETRRFTLKTPDSMRRILMSW